MWELGYQEDWGLKNWWFWTVVLEKTLENPLDCKEIKLVHPKGNQSWIFIGRTDAEAETPILCPHDAKKWLFEKSLMLEKIEKIEKGTTEDEMTRWHQGQRTWVWVNSRSWWWTGRPGVLQSMGSQSWTQLNDWPENWNMTTDRENAPNTWSQDPSCELN